MSTLFAYIDVDRSNYITFTGKHTISLEFEDNLIEKEFLMVAIEKSKILTKKNVTSAFKLMDSVIMWFMYRTDSMWFRTTMDVFLKMSSYAI